MPAVEWRKIAGMCEWLTHVYSSIDSDILWDVVENQIPELIRELQAFQGNEHRDQRQDSSSSSQNT